MPRVSKRGAFFQRLSVEETAEISNSDSEIPCSSGCEDDKILEPIVEKIVMRGCCNYLGYGWIMALNAVLRIGLMAAVILLVGCANQGRAVAHIADQAEALALQRQLGSSRNFDLSRVTVARLKVDGEPIEVTSLLPALIARSAKGSATAVTIFVFTRALDRLILFTRGGNGGGAYRLDLPVANWQPGDPVQFPVANADGTLAERRVELVKFIVRH